MSDQNIFGNNPPATPPAATNVQPQDSFADLLGSIKNERGEPKYKDINTALDALKHSQEFIPQLRTEKERLEQELANMRKEVDRLKTVEETVERLTSQNTPPVATPPAGTLTEEAVANLVTQTLTAREQQALRDSNLSQVVNKMKETFGDDAEKAFYSKAQEVGMSKEAINALAAQSPQAVLKLFGVGDKQSPGKTPFSPTPGSINADGYQPQQKSFLGRNTSPVILGATSEELAMEKNNSAALVEELHKHNLSTYDLTDPKVYFKHFGKI